jgi:hypothetical protein
MSIPAAEGTAEIRTPPVARVSEEKDPAVPAALQAGPQVRFGLQEGAQDDVVLQDKAEHLALSVPVRPGLEAALDFYDKKPRLWLTILMFLCMLSSYRPATTSSRYDESFFVGTSALRKLPR